MGAILKLIMAGASRAKIVAKYGQKAYNAVISRYGSKGKIMKAAKDPDALALILETAPEQIAGIALVGTGLEVSRQKIIKNLEKKENKAKRGPRDEKTYSKGGGVRKPKY
jgi:hypothetical protein|tara:strand:+ start:196 stop:525 length:330 start_codon:yes stop_codon:yes gene_type:complete